MTRFDAHGGWIASPIDLLRVLVRVDGQGTKPDLLSSDSYTTMTTPAGILNADGKDPKYGLGWSVPGTSQSHNGSMAGSLGQLVRWKDGWTYAAVVNQRSDADKWAGNLSNMVQEVIGKVGIVVHCADSLTQKEGRHLITGPGIFLTANEQGG